MGSAKVWQGSGLERVRCGAAVCGVEFYGMSSNRRSVVRLGMDWNANARFGWARSAVVLFGSEW